MPRADGAAAGEAPRSTPRWRSALRRERARAGRRRRSSSSGSCATALRRRSRSGGWSAQAAAGAAFDALDRLGGIAAPTLVLHGTEDDVVDPRNAAAARRADPRTRALELFAGRGHLLLLGAARARSSSS